MVRVLVRSLLSAGLGLALALFAGVVWLIWTPSGSSWLVRGVLGLPPGSGNVGMVAGRLGDHLILDGLHFPYEGGVLTVERAVLDWSPGKLFRGRLEIAELSLTGVELLLDDERSPEPTDTEPARPLLLEWPELTGWPLRVAGEIQSLRLERLVIRTPSEILWQMESWRGSLAWRSGVAGLSAMEMVLPEGRITGNLALDLPDGTLRGQLLALPKESPGGVERLELLLDLRQEGGDWLAGQLHGRAWRRDEVLLAARIPLAVERERLRIHQARIELPGRGDLLAFDGTLSLGEALAWQVDVDARRVDLSELAGVALLLDGRISAEGEGDRYRGRFDLRNRSGDWLESVLAGELAGDATRLDLSGLQGEWLAGTLTGALELDWRQGFSLRGDLRGRRFDLARLSPEAPGQVSLDLRFDLSQTADEPLRLGVDGSLLESTLHGQSLNGELSARLHGKDLEIVRLDLRGADLALRARGRLAQRLDVELDLGRLQGLVPELSGAARGRGWLSWDGNSLAGDITVNGTDLAYGGDALAVLEVSVRKSAASDALEGWVKGREGQLAGLEIKSLALDGSGLLEEHRAVLEIDGDLGRARLLAQGGWREESWNGFLRELAFTETPAGDWRLSDPVALRLDAHRAELAPARLVSALGEEIDLAGSLAFASLDGDLTLGWRGLRLAHAQPWVEDWRIDGATQGEVRLSLRQGRPGDLAARLKVAGDLSRGEAQYDLSDLQLLLDWDDNGLRVELSGDGGDLGQLHLSLSSPEAPGGGWPESGVFSLTFDNLTLARLSPAPPAGLSLYGQFAAALAGGWQQGTDFFLDGRAAIEGGRLGWHEDELRVGAELRKAEIVLSWRGEELLAEADFELNQHGRLRGRLQWPLAARWPVQVDSQAPLRGEMTASLAEKGLLVALFPGLVRETSGQLEVAATLEGPPAAPRVAGTFTLSGAAAYLPAAGLNLKDVNLRGRLAGEEIELEEARVTSGDGTLRVRGKIVLADWALADYRFSLSGEKVEAVNLPELQLHLSPELELSGDAGRLRLRGKVLVPYALVRGRENVPPVRSSPDVVLVDAPEPVSTGEPPLDVDVAVRVILGDRVLVKAAGVDARLGGEVEILARDLEEISGRGRIEIKEGAYSAYGIGLKVERGNILFAGGPVDRPTLDILALRRAGEVKTGVRVTGTPRQPLVKLYSDPLMPDTDILSYMVLGRPLGAATGGDTDLLMTAAGVLLSQGESVVLQDRLKRRLGIDVLEVQAGSGDVSTSMVTIGKYLGPRLYISLGHSLFTSTNEFRMRYRLFERWELESSVGVESGADLYYLIEFE